MSDPVDVPTDKLAKHAAVEAYFAVLRQRIIEKLQGVSLPLRVRAETPYGTFADVVIDILRVEEQNAILWGTNCPACAHRVNQQYEAHVEAEKTGMLWALHALSEAIRLTVFRHTVQGDWPRDARSAYVECVRILRRIKRRVEENRVLTSSSAEARYVTTPRAPSDNPSTPGQKGSP